MKNYIQLFENWQREEEFILTSKMARRGDPKIIFRVKDGRIESIENENRYPFPYFQGQPFQKPFIGMWACKNGFYLNREDTCKSKQDDNDKIFGVRKKDVPRGHEWRQIWPGKFRD